MAPLPAAFAFTAGPQSFSVTAPITTPAAFTWAAGGSFTVPATADPAAANVAALSVQATPLSTRSFQRAGNVPTLSWASDPGALYQVEWSDNLRDWTQGPVLSAIGATSCYSDPAANAAARFYRVRRIP